MLIKYKKLDILVELVYIFPRTEARHYIICYMFNNVEGGSL